MLHISIPLFGMELLDCDKVFTIPTNIITLMKSRGTNYLRNLMPCKLPENLYFHYCPLLHTIEKFQTNWGIHSINVRYKHVPNAKLISYQKCVRYARTALFNTLSSNKTLYQDTKLLKAEWKDCLWAHSLCSVDHFILTERSFSSVQIINNFLTQIARCVLLT